MCGVEVTCQEREHRTNCTLKSLRWWSAANEQHNKEINDKVNMCKQEDVDLLVDLSNFVMMDLGQPNHVFDRNRLESLGSGRGIDVRDAR